MAIEATKIYTKHPELFDDGMRRFILGRPLLDDLITLELTASANHSKKINEHKGPCMILAGAGMCNAGRIVHHLKHNLCRRRHMSFSLDIKDKTRWAAASWNGNRSLTFMASGFLYAHKFTL